MKRIREILRQVQVDVINGENLDAYIAIMLAVVFTVLDLLDVVDFKVLGAAILLTLTLLVVGTLTNRRIFDKLKRTMDALSDQKEIVKRFQPPDSMVRERIRSARSVALSGISLYRFIPTFYVDIEYALQQGGKLRVMLVDPNDESIGDMLALRSPEGIPKATEQKRIQDTLDFLTNMRRRLPHADIEIRTLPYLMPYGINILEPRVGEAAEKWCFVRVHAFKASTYESPVLSPEPVSHERWFRFFEEQYDNMWQMAKPYLP